jgi:hypothetical protein
MSQSAENHDQSAEPGPGDPGDPGDPEKASVYRIVPRVSDNPFIAFYNPFVRLGTCVRCKKPVWLTDDDLPRWMVPLCVWCGLDDPELHDIVGRMLGALPEREAEVEAEGGSEADAALHRNLAGCRRRQPARK